MAESSTLFENAPDFRDEEQTDAIDAGITLKKGKPQTHLIGSNESQEYSPKQEQKPLVDESSHTENSDGLADELKSPSLETQSTPTDGVFFQR